MKRKAYLMVFDGLADWEPAHALCEINKSGKFEIVTVGFSRETVTTMGGLKLAPEITIDEINPDDAAIFILPGGDMWQEKGRPEVDALLQRLHQNNVLIGALCAATLEIARAGLTQGIRHTSNAKSFLKMMVPGYRDESLYVDELAVTDQNIITASGLGSIEFGREVIRQLGLYSKTDTETWYGMFKHGLIPAGTV
jgi:putative intracellular protease/amidase